MLPRDIESDPSAAAAAHQAAHQVLSESEGEVVAALEWSSSHLKECAGELPTHIRSWAKAVKVLREQEELLASTEAAGEGRRDGGGVRGDWAGRGGTGRFGAGGGRGGGPGG